jgi:hypothetical protein
LTLGATARDCGVTVQAVRTMSAARPRACDHVVVSEREPADVRFRRVRTGRRRWGIFGQQRAYEVWQADGRRDVLDLHRLDKLLDACQYPADFWTCVKAADAAWTSGEHNVLIEWPSGIRRPAT